MLPRTRPWSWLTRATGTLAAWGLAVSWAHAQPPSKQPSSAGAETKSGSPGAPAQPRSIPRPRTTPPPPPTRGAGDPAVTEPEPEPQPSVDLSETWGYSRAGTPRPRYIRNTQDPIAFAANPVGFYSGVSVQGNQLPPHPVEGVGNGPATMTWTGFERTSSGSRVFFQLSNEADYSLSQKNGVITVRLRRTKVNVRNNLRRLDLSYFKTPVHTVKVRRRGRDAIATITLKTDATPEVSYVDSGGSGYKLLVLSFTHGTSAVDPPQRTSAQRTNAAAAEEQ